MIAWIGEKRLDDHPSMPVWHRAIKVNDIWYEVNSEGSKMPIEILTDAKDDKYEKIYVLDSTFTVRLDSLNLAIKEYEGTEYDILFNNCQYFVNSVLTNSGHPPWSSPLYQSIYVEYPNNYCLVKKDYIWDYDECIEKNIMLSDSSHLAIPIAFSMYVFGGIYFLLN